MKAIEIFADCVERIAAADIQSDQVPSKIDTGIDA